MLDTYTEISKSGRGIHCIFIANKIGNVCKNNDLDFCDPLEMYDRGRYFALTGNIIRNKDAEYRQEECQKVYELYFKSKEQKIITTCSENKERTGKKYKGYGADYLNYIFERDKKFKKIWFREITITDESVTDLAFFSKLAYWLDEKTDLMQEWFYKSPYFNGKDEKHRKKALRPDYIKRTIEKAISYYRNKRVK